MRLRPYERQKPQALLSSTTLFKSNLTLTLDLPCGNMSLLSPWHHSCTLDKSVMFHQPPAGPKHTSAHWRSSGGVIKLLNGSQKSRREAGEGTTNRLSKSWPEDVSASWVATSPVATEAKNQHLEREMLCYPDWSKCIRLIGFQSEMRDAFNVLSPLLAGPPNSYMPQRKISETYLYTSTYSPSSYANLILFKIRNAMQVRNASYTHNLKRNQPPK